MNKIEVYAINNYPWCVQARTLFKSKEINISSGSNLAQEIIDRSGQFLVAQIFI